MLSTYPACFYKEKKGGYSVIFPDLNHLATCGETLEEALFMSLDCLAGYLQWAKEDGDFIPIPSDIKSINPIDEAKKINIDSDEYDETFVTIIPVDVDEYAQKYFKKDKITVNTN
jgi:predicted RNase H-like HicB family nuclease